MEKLRSAIYQSVSAVFVSLLLYGCAVGPKFSRPRPPTENKYSANPLTNAPLEADGKSQHFVNGAPLVADWWRLFKSPQLSAFVEQAFANNQTLKAAEFSLLQSQDNVRAGQGVFFPQISANADGRRQRNSQLQQSTRAPGSIFNLFTLGLTVDYALDIFGGERRAVEGLRAEADYQRYIGEAAYLTLSANVVNTCIARAAYRGQISATQQLIELENQQLKGIAAQVESGSTAYTDLLSLRTLIAGNQAALAPLEQKADEATNLLAVLEGQSPAEGALPELELQDISLPETLPVSLPSDLVRQRPDILAAEAQLHSASAAIGVATAAMFPSFSISGSYGSSAPLISNLSASSNRFWNIGPSATIPLFQGGAFWYGRRAAINAYRRSEANYRQTVLMAFEQVADSLQAVQHDAQALQAQAGARTTAEEALRIVQANERAGLVAYFQVLTADIQYQEATIGYLQATAQRQQDTVALFIALGGGWWNQSPSMSDGRSR